MICLRDFYAGGSSNFTTGVCSDDKFFFKVAFKVKKIKHCLFEVAQITLKGGFIELYASLMFLHLELCTVLVPDYKSLFVP
jgi:hypothetical protein